MAVSNQLRGPSNKSAKAVPVPSGAGKAKFSAHASGLNKQNVAAAIALKGKTHKVALATGSTSDARR